jgi:hypothetical protein
MTAAMAGVARDPDTGRLQSAQTVEERFWSKVNKDGPIPPHCPELGPCWEWTAGVDKDGYGKFVISRPAGVEPREITVRPHRFAWELEHGPLGDALLMHRCDNRRCVRNAHTCPGTHQENIADRHAKGRDASGDRHASRTHPETRLRGEAHPRATITEHDVRRIRAMHRDQPHLTWRQIANELGLPLLATKTAGGGRSWRHVQ